MQQPYFSLSPMAGQESFGSSLDVRPTHHVITPTTSSMLAALQQDPFPAGTLDPSSTAFGSDAYGSLSYLDASTPHDDGMPAVHQPGLSFADYGSTNSFDVAAFAPQDLGMTPSVESAHSESEHEVDPVKSEPSA